MDIKVVGTGCEKCSKLYENTLEALRITGVEATVEKVEDLMEIVKLRVMSTPSLIVDGKLLVSGHVASAQQIAALLTK